MEVLQVGMVLQSMGSAEINTNTVISLATVLVLIGAAWRLSATLTKICEQLRPLQKVPDRLARVESQVRDVRSHVEGLEEDVNLLWTTERGEPLDKIRHRNRRPWPDYPPDNDRGEK